MSRFINGVWEEVWQKRLILTVVLAAVFVFCPVRSEAAPYTYQNDQYGFSIVCPEKPQGVISLDKPEEKGVLIVFEGTDQNVVSGWVVLADAFTIKDMPDLKMMSPEDTDQYTKALVKSAGNESAEVLAVGERLALYTISKETPKIATAYFQGQKNYMISMIAPEEAFAQREKEFKENLLTFHEQAVAE